LKKNYDYGGLYFIIILYVIKNNNKILTCAQKLASSQLNLPYGTKQKSNEETKNKTTEMLRRNGPVVKSVESVLWLEGSL